MFSSISEAHEETPGRRCGRGSPRAGHHAIKLSSSTKSVLVFACENENYTPAEGDQVVQCIDKKWTGTPLECRSKSLVMCVVCVSVCGVW